MEVLAFIESIWSELIGVTICPAFALFLISAISFFSWEPTTSISFHTASFGTSLPVARACLSPYPVLAVLSEACADAVVVFQQA